MQLSYEKSGTLHLVEPGHVRQSGRLADEIQKF